MNLNAFVICPVGGSIVDPKIGIKNQNQRHALRLQPEDGGIGAHDGALSA